MLYKTIAKARTTLARTSTYLSLANFTILLGITLKWLHNSILPNSNFILWMTLGYSTALISILTLSKIDRKSIWPQELNIHQSINPLTPILILQAANIVASHPENEILCKEITKRMVEANQFDQFIQYLSLIQGFIPASILPIPTPREELQAPPSGGAAGRHGAPQRPGARRGE